MDRRTRTRQDVAAFSIDALPLDQAQSLARAQADVLALLELPGDVFSRHHFEPGHLTASAFLIDSKTQSLFLILHKKLNLWLQPGGHIEAADVDIPGAAFRELVEESGAQDARLRPALFDIDVHEIPAHKDEPAHRHYDLRYAFDVGDIAPHLTDEVQDARYFSFAELAQSSDDASVKRVARRLLTPG